MRFVQIFVYRIRKLAPLARLKQLCLELLGARIGPHTRLPFTVEVDWPHRIKIGASCVINSNVSLHVDGPWGLGEAIEIGNRVFLGRRVEFNITQFVKIGDDTLIGSDTKFIDHNHGTAINKKIREQPCPSSSIVVDQDCWIGSSCIILKGVHIGKGAIVGAGSLVNMSIPECEIWAGVPAKKIGKRS